MMIKAKAFPIAIPMKTLTSTSTLKLRVHVPILLLLLLSQLPLPSHSHYQQQHQHQQQQQHAFQRRQRINNLNQSSLNLIQTLTQQEERPSQDKLDKYSSLPHTIFSSQGRLYNVEKASQLSSNKNDITSSLVIAIGFGNGTNRNNEGKEKEEGEGADADADGEASIVLIGTKPISPYSYECNHSNHNSKDENNESHTTRIPLFINVPPSPTTTTTTNTYPISILSPNLLLATGGNSVDSITLHNRILEIFLSLSKSHDGLRGSSTSTSNENSSSSSSIIQGSIKSSLLARKIADSLQSSTQDVTSNYGRILSSSTIVIGINEDSKIIASSSSPSTATTTTSSTSTNNTSKNNSGYNIWRIDPTGQFWKCTLATVGRGAGYVEHSMLEHVYKWKQNCKRKDHHQQQQQQDDDIDVERMDMSDLLLMISNEDVKECWKNMSFDDVIEFICDCLCKVYNVKDENDLQKVGVEGVLITKDSRVENSNENKGSYCAEMIHDQIIKQCLISKVRKVD